MAMLSNVPEAMRPLLPELAASLGDYLLRVRQALARGDAPVAAEAAHAVKGAAMYYRLPVMARVAGELEDRCRALSQAAPAGKGRTGVLAVLERAEAELAALRAALEAGA